MVWCLTADRIHQQARFVKWREVDFVRHPAQNRVRTSNGCVRQVCASWRRRKRCVDCYIQQWRCIFGQISTKQASQTSSWFFSRATDGIRSPEHFCSVAHSGAHPVKMFRGSERITRAQENSAEAKIAIYCETYSKYEPKLSTRCLMPASTNKFFFA